MRKDNESVSPHRESPTPGTAPRRKLPPARSDWPFGPRPAPLRDGEVFRPDPTPLRERRPVHAENLNRLT
jgi:hypothetical protein